MNNFTNKSSLLIKHISNIYKMRLSKNLISSDSSSSIPQYETLKISVPSNFVYHVELNRPDKRNAMSHQMWLDVKDCFEHLNDDDNCRSIVLSGNGNMFCAGIDLGCFADMSKNFKPTDDVARKSKAVYKTIKLYQDSLSSLEKCVKPVISAVHSGCIGAGINMVCSADIRYCSTDAWYQIKEIDLGMAADVGAIQRLPKIVGSASLVRELIFTGRKFLSGEAKDIGFVNRVFDTKELLIEESLKVAAEIASKSPVGIQTAKKSLVYSLDHTNDEGLEYLALMNQIMLQSDDIVAAVTATFAKTGPPVFSKL